MFHECKTEEDVKRVFRKSAQLFHPDKGGDAELMNLLVEAKDLALDAIEMTNEWVEKNSKKKTRKKRKYERANPSEKVRKGSRDLDFIETMQMYADNNPRFKSKFFFSVIDQLDKKGYITIAQFEGLKNVYNSFKMEDWLEEFLESEEDEDTEAL